jgi:hypothetical protein
MRSHAVCVPPYQLRMAEQIFVKLGMDIMTTEPISKAYFINPSHQCVYLCVYPSYRSKATARCHATARKTSSRGKEYMRQ